MFCCGDNMKEKLSEELNCKFEETDKGFKVEVSAKDSEKTDALKQMFKACKSFCKGSDCCK